MSRKTPSEIYAMTSDFLRGELSSSGIPGLEEDRTLTWITDLQDQFFDDFKAAGGLPPKYMRKTVGITALGTTTLGEAVTTASTDFDVASDDVLYTEAQNAAVIYSQGQFDVFTHGVPASNNLPSIEGIEFSHASGDTVHALHKLPANFKDVHVGRNHEGLTLNGFGGFKEVDEFPQGLEFSIYEDDDENFYLWVPRGITSGNLAVYYEKKPTAITEANFATTQLEIRSPDHWYVVYGLAGIFKHVLDDSYVPVNERALQREVIGKAIARRTVGKRISASDAYFQRYTDPVDVGFYLPTDE